LGAAFILKRSAWKPAIFRAVLLGSIAAAVGIIYLFHRNGGFLSEADWKIFWPTIEGLMWAGFLVTYIGAKIMPGFLSRFLIMIGEASFSIYLLHFPIVQFVTRRADLFGLADPLALTAFAILPMIIAISLLSYNVIELPFLGLRRKYLM
jgi:peptidoglycan/LPS O-acetylase OafA/YrhL